MRYVEEFLGLKCVGDVLNVVNPVQNITKEITESMAVIHIIRNTLILNPNKYRIFDFCAGNCLTSVLASFLYKAEVIAYDIRNRDRDWEKVRNFEFCQQDITKLDYSFTRNDIIIGVHCDEFAWNIVDIFNKSEVGMIVIEPCCLGCMVDKDLLMPHAIFNRMSNYEQWCYYLYSNINSRYKHMKIDKWVRSPKNCLIWAVKGE